MLDSTSGADKNHSTRGCLKANHWGGWTKPVGENPLIPPFNSHPGYNRFMKHKSSRLAVLCAFSL